MFGVFFADKVHLMDQDTFIYRKIDQPLLCLKKRKKPKTCWLGVVFLPFPHFFYPLILLCILFTFFPLLHRPLSLNLAVTLFTVIFTFFFLSQERWCSEVLMIGSGLIISTPIRATTICCMAFKPYTAAFHIYMFEMWMSITDPRRPAVLV